MEFHFKTWCGKRSEVSFALKKCQDVNQVEQSQLWSSRDSTGPITPPTRTTTLNSMSGELQY